MFYIVRQEWSKGKVRLVLNPKLFFDTQEQAAAAYKRLKRRRNTTYEIREKENS